MEPLTYIECISANLLVSQCCVCGVVVGYKDAKRELQIGDQVISHTYCSTCWSHDEFIDVDY